MYPAAGKGERDEETNIHAFGARPARDRNPRIRPAKQRFGTLVEPSDPDSGRTDDSAAWAKGSSRAAESSAGKVTLIRQALKNEDGHHPVAVFFREGRSVTVTSPRSILPALHL
jgi:hypothetical protein